MAGNPIVEVGLEATSCGMKAKINDLDQQSVDDLRNVAERTIEDPNDPLRQACIGFVTQYELKKYDIDQLRDLGAWLCDFVNNYRPVPDQSRADIHG